VSAMVPVAILVVLVLIALLAPVFGHDSRPRW
jgi:hypothetical protein